MEMKSTVTSRIVLSTQVLAMAASANAFGGDGWIEFTSPKAHEATITVSMPTKPDFAAVPLNTILGEFDVNRLSAESDAYTKPAGERHRPEPANGRSRRRRVTV